MACVVDGRGTGGDAAGEGGIVVDVEFEEVEEGVCYEGDCAVEFCVCPYQHLSSLYPWMKLREDLPSSIPYCNSSGCPVSLQTGKGAYTSSFFSLEMCSPVSLSFYQRLFSNCTTLSNPLPQNPTQEGETNSHAPIQTTNRNRRPIMITR